MMTNYCAMPFMLLGVKRSLVGWANVGWYGHFMIGGTMAFFYAGGTGYLKRIQARRIKKYEGKISPPTGPATPNPLVAPPVDIALDEVDKKL